MKFLDEVNRNNGNVVIGLTIKKLQADIDALDTFRKDYFTRVLAHALAYEHGMKLVLRCKTLEDAHQVATKILEGKPWEIPEEIREPPDGYIP